jgi:hypothetical protein
MILSFSNQGDRMKLVMILAILLILIGGCSTVQDSPSGPTIEMTPVLSGIQELSLNAQDLQQLGMMNNGTDCQTEDYQTDADSPLAQYGICSYSINRLNDTEVVIQLEKYANVEALNGSYQYNSLHLRSIEGLISENDFGDQSRFYINNVNDYGGQFNDPNISYYALYICKDKYIIHISSKGSKDAREYVTQIGQLILSKFG